MPGVFVACLVTVTKYQTETILKKKYLKRFTVFLLYRGREGLAQQSNSCHDRSRGLDREMPTLGFLVPFPPSVLFQDPRPWDGSIHVQDESFLSVNSWENTPTNTS